MKRISPLQIWELVAKKRLSFVLVMIATVLIVGLALGVLYYKANLARCYEMNVIGERYLLGIQSYIITDLDERGVSDLREVRKRFLAKWSGDSPPPPPLRWTALDIISKDAEYEGRVICYVPTRYFGRFARTTMCVVLKRDWQGDVYSVFTKPLKGAPDLLREKRAGGWRLLPHITPRGGKSNGSILLMTRGGPGSLRLSRR
jgi:hypothetical protein